MKTLLNYCLLAAIIFSFQPYQASAVEASEGPKISKQSNVSYQFNQNTGALTLNLVTNSKTEMVFVSLIKTTGSSSAAGPDMFMERLTVTGGTRSFKLDLSDLTAGTYKLIIHSQSIDFEDQVKIF